MHYMRRMFLISCLKANRVPITKITGVAMENIHILNGAICKAKKIKDFR